MRNYKRAAIASGILALRSSAALAGETLTGEFLYTGEVWQVASGGLQTGSRYLHNIDISIGADLDRHGIPGGSLFLYGLSNNKAELSGDLIGDSQVISNIDNGEVFRLFEAWFQQEIPGLGYGARYKLGLVDLNSEFDVIETAGLFLNSSHGIGPEFSQTGENGPSIFPTSSPAFLLEVFPAEGLRLSAGIFDAVPNNPARPQRHKLSLGEGALLVGEINYSFASGLRMGLGAFTYTSHFEPLLDGPDNMVGGNSGVYSVIETPIGDRLAGWIRFGVADSHINPISHYAGAGLVLSAPLKGRPDDQLGLAVASAWYGRDNKSLILSEGGNPTDSEIEIELTYRFQLGDHLALQPDVQYVVNPGGVRGIGDALVLGVRLEVGLGLF